MSLKAFHILFVTAAVMLSFGFAAWCLRAYGREQQTSNLVMGVGSIVAGVGLIVYGIAVYRKLRKVPTA